MDLSCSLSSSEPGLHDINYKEEPGLLYLLLEIKQTDAQRAEPIPSNLSFIIDASDSMHIRLVTDKQFSQLVKNGQVSEVMTDGVPAYQVKTNSLELLAAAPRKIDYVREALNIISNHLRPNDYFSVIAFASRAHCVIETSSGKDRQRLHQAARDIEYLKLGDETHMAEGLALAYSQLSQPLGKSYARRMVLLTDGHTRNVKACYQLAGRAHQESIKLSTMGIGSEFNEELLIPLADMTAGNAYYLQSPDQIPSAFLQEMGSALNISFRNVEIKLNLNTAFEIIKAFKVIPEISRFEIDQGQAGSYSLFLGDYASTEMLSLLLEIRAPLLPFEKSHFAQVLLTWEDPQDAFIRQNQRQDLIFNQAGTGQLPQDARVMALVEKINVYKSGMQALLTAQKAVKMDDSQEKKRATLRLRQAATSLLDMGAADLGSVMLQQAEMLEHQGSFDSDAVKKMRYETRRITKHL